jgi:hypothetical protein
MIIWREKFRAVAIHFVATLLLAAIAAAVIFGVWYPAPLGTMAGGTELFMLVVGCDIALGPLLSLVIYDSSKTRRHLLMDYTVVGVVQLVALGYGVWVVYDVRPVYIAFNHDRYEIVVPMDIQPDELAAAREDRYRTLPITGPKLIGIVVPPADKQDAMFQAVSGRDTHQRPKFYAPYEAVLDRVKEKAAPLATLETKHPEAKSLIAAEVAKTGIAAEKLGWLPVRGGTTFWTALVDESTGQPVHYFALDPY